MKILIVKGNTELSTKKLVSSGCRNYTDIFGDILKYFYPGTVVHTINSTDLTKEIMNIAQLQTFSGAMWTGSLLSAYDSSAEVAHQLKLSEQIFKSQIPYYGSCYGIQIAATAAGGTVAPAINGLEIGLCEPLQLTKDGRDHPLLHGRKNGDRVMCLHNDEIVKLPPRSKVLISNKHSAIQGVEIEHLGGKFVGVQYHPEFSLDDMVGLYSYAQDYLLEKKYKGNADMLLHDRERLKDRDFYDEFYQNFYQSHCIEIYNWLRFMVQ